MNQTLLHFDDIIYQLQQGGGASLYWREMTSRITADPEFSVVRTTGRQWHRILPVPSHAHVFHSSHFRIPFGRGVRVVETIYDLTYELGYLKTRGSALNIWERKQAAQRADAVICISQSTKRDLLNLYPDLNDKKLVQVIPLASSFSDDPEPNMPTPRLANMMAQTRNRIVLYVGTRAHYKNFDAALSGFAESVLPAQCYSLVCTGPAFSDNERRDLERLSLQDKVISFERASASELKQIYQIALALVYPSRYEGFGLPVLESMSAGCPVIAANASCLPEVVGDAGILVHPDRPEEISRALETLLDDNTRQDFIRRGKRRAKLFSWDKVTEQHKAVYRSLHKA